MLKSNSKLVKLFIICNLMVSKWQFYALNVDANQSGASLGETKSDLRSNSNIKKELRRKCFFWYSFKQSCSQLPCYRVFYLSENFALITCSCFDLLMLIHYTKISNSTCHFISACKPSSNLSIKCIDGCIIWWSFDLFRFTSQMSMCSKQIFTTCLMMTFTNYFTSHDLLVTCW